DDLRQRDATRVVAHVRAVRKVVRAEHPADELVQKRRLVAGTPRRVEHAALRAGAVQLAREQIERGVPADRPVVTTLEDEWLDEAAELAELEVREQAQIVDRQL